MLAACGNKEEDLSAEEREKVIEDGTVGFETAGGIIERAENVPADEEKAILVAFDEYIEAFNEQDIERFMQTLSKKPAGFNLEEEKEYATQVFEQFDIKRAVEDVTITKYSEKEAQVHAKITTNLLQKGTDVLHDDVGKQITVFVNEDDTWKVTSTFYVGADSKSSTAIE